MALCSDKGETMNPQDENRDVSQHCFDPFPEPQTIPSGWDTSAILSAPMPAPAQRADNPSESNPDKS
jgi:hypothetical protein